ncbi:hypothetical protein TWF281_003076 [Arthrobotrys megalospora]
MQFHPSLPTPTSSPTSPLSPCSTRQQVLNLLLKLNPSPSLPPEYPDPPTDRLRGMIYAAACQRIQNRAKLPHNTLQKAFNLLEISTDLTGYLFPLHSYDLQVDICVKIVLFNLLLSEKEAIEDFEKLRGYMASRPAFSAPNTASAMDNGFVSYLAEEAGFTSTTASVSEISPPSSPRHNRCSSKNKSFSSISQARVQLALMEGVIHGLIQTRSSEHPNGVAQDSISEAFISECLLKILPNWIFPVDEFGEERHGSIYLPVTEDFVGFSRAISTVMATCNIHPSQADKTHLLPIAIEDAIAHYTSLQNTFQTHPQLQKFSEAYLRGLISATLGTSDGFKHFFMSD